MMFNNIIKKLPALWVFLLHFLNIIPTHDQNVRPVKTKTEKRIKTIQRARGWMAGKTRNYFHWMRQRTFRAIHTEFDKYTWENNNVPTVSFRRKVAVPVSWSRKGIAGTVSKGNLTSIFSFWHLPKCKTRVSTITSSTIVWCNWGLHPH